MTILSPRAFTVSATIHPVSVGSVGPSDFTVYAKGPMVRKMSGRVKWRIRGAKRLASLIREESFDDKERVFRNYRIAENINLQLFYR